MLSLLRALAFLTILPVRSAEPFQPATLPGTLIAFPWAGALLGAALGAAFHGLLLILPPELAAAFTVALSAMLTRGLHLDGLADTADGLLGGHTVERRLEIMKDPRVGSFGTIAVVLALLVQAAALLALARVQPQDGALLLRTGTGALLGLLSRTLAVQAMHRNPYARAAGGTGAELFKAARSGWVGICGAALPLLAALAVAWHFGVAPAAALVAAGTIAVLLEAAAYRLLKGQTGDTVGALIVLSETAALAALAGVLVPR